MNKKACALVLVLFLAVAGTIWVTTFVFHGNNKERLLSQPALSTALSTREAMRVQQDFETTKQGSDMSNWKTYQSDEFGYSITLPPNFKFVDEYYGEEIAYDPSRSFFDLDDSSGFPSFHFYVEQITPEDFVTRRNKETIRKNDLIKLFSKDGVDYFDLYDSPNFPLPRIMYRDQIMLFISNYKDVDVLKQIIASVEL